MKTAVERIEILEEKVTRLERIHVYGAVALLILIPVLIYVKANRS